MGDEAQKRNTDCVYFLASPLTCKKGDDCEYRHSEAARVNPRDCWYWLSGNCLNASCSFRHPPLDGRPGVSASNPSHIADGTSSVATTPPPPPPHPHPPPAAAPSVPSTSTAMSAPPMATKSTVPCFFFSQGYCAKGGKCPFLHSPPTSYRKEATTYQRPQVNEQPANGEGNGVSYAKEQGQDHRTAFQTKAPVRAAFPSQEAGYVPSNVYKLSALVPSGKRFPGNSGKKVDQPSQVGRPKVVHNADDDTTRHAQLVERRISQAHSNECMEQFPTDKKGALKGQLLDLDSGILAKQSRQSSAAYLVRNDDTLLSLEMQDQLYELEGQHRARELHANDLRNHLKRKKNDTAYSGQIRDFCTKEFSKDRSEGGGRLASRAVSTAESNDCVPKRAKQERESSTFSGPKSLAQIKAEKSPKTVTQDSPKASDPVDDCRSVEPDHKEVQGMVQSASKLNVNLLPMSSKEFLNDHSGTLVEETKFEVKKSSELSGTSQNSRLGVGSNESNGLLSVVVPHRVSKEVEMAASKEDITSILKGRQGAMNGDSKCAHHAPEGIRIGTDYVSTDEFMEDASEAPENVTDPDYVLDYDEEDDFARKLGSFLS